MLGRTKSIIKQQVGKVLKKQDPPLSAADVEKARRYIQDYWKKLERFHPKDDETLIGLPNIYLVPSAPAAGHEFDFDEMYYWDSYFIAQGLLDDKNQQLVEGMLENLCTMFERFKVIPNASRVYFAGRSQPPLLTTFIFDIYDRYNKDKKWLKKYITIAKQEYEIVWMGEKKPNARRVYEGLSRYYDFNHLDDIAETESGWDMTPRFHRKAMSYLPVDLNALLYKYETDFARAARLLGNKTEADKWVAAGKKRVRVMDQLMWNSLDKFYFDYNFTKERRGSVESLAGFFPMWAGMVSDHRAAQLVRRLRKFEYPGGLATTEGSILPKKFGGVPMQWAYPNGWAPLQLIVVQALQRYGYHEDAARIALKWLNGNLYWYEKHGEFLEKYNVVNPQRPPVKGVYPSQVGFGWTNAVFERFCQEFIDNNPPLPYNKTNT